MTDPAETRRALQNGALRAAARQRGISPRVVLDLADRTLLQVHLDGIVTGAHDAVDALLERREVPADRQYEKRPPRFTIDGGGGQQGTVLAPWDRPPEPIPVTPSGVRAWWQESWAQGIGTPDPKGPMLRPLPTGTRITRAPLPGRRPWPWETDDGAEGRG